MQSAGIRVNPATLKGSVSECAFAGQDCDFRVNCCSGLTCDYRYLTFGTCIASSSSSAPDTSCRATGGPEICGGTCATLGWGCSYDPEAGGRCVCKAPAASSTSSSSVACVTGGACDCANCAENCTAGQCDSSSSPACLSEGAFCGVGEGTCCGGNCGCPGGVSGCAVDDEICISPIAGDSSSASAPTCSCQNPGECKPICTDGSLNPCTPEGQTCAQLCGTPSSCGGGSSSSSSSSSPAQCCNPSTFQCETPSPSPPVCGEGTTQCGTFANCCATGQLCDETTGACSDLPACGGFGQPPCSCDPLTVSCGPFTHACVDTSRGCCCNNECLSTAGEGGACGGTVCCPPGYSCNAEVCVL